MNIFVIDKTSKQNLGMLDFIPKKDERVLLNENEWKSIECVVDCVVYAPRDHGVLVFVNVVAPYYSSMISEIKWK